MKKYLTIQGQKRMLDELAYLKSEKRVVLSEQLKFATSLGDLRENSEYDAVCEDFQITENRIFELEKQLKDAIVYQRKNDGTVEIGSIVTLKIEDEIEQYEIVGFHESDIAQNKISYESSLGKALIGKRINETGTVESEMGGYDVMIIDIH